MTAFILRGHTIKHLKWKFTVFQYLSCKFAISYIYVSNAISHEMIEANKIQKCWFHYACWSSAVTCIMCEALFGRVDALKCVYLFCSIEADDKQDNKSQSKIAWYSAKFTASTPSTKCAAMSECFVNEFICSRRRQCIKLIDFSIRFYFFLSILNWK